MTFGWLYFYEKHKSQDLKQNSSPFKNPWVSLISLIKSNHCPPFRWWTYQLWVKFFSEIQNPIFMPAHVANKIESLTYVEDVAEVVMEVISRGKDVWNEAYNIAMEEEFSLSNILLRMRDGLSAHEVCQRYLCTYVT